MIVVVASLKTPAGIEDIVQLPVRPDLANHAVPTLWPPGITGNRREFPNPHTWRETHLVMKVVLDHRVCTTELPYFVPVLHGSTSRQAFVRNSRCQRLHQKAVNSKRLTEPEVGIGSKR